MQSFCRIVWIFSHIDINRHHYLVLVCKFFNSVFSAQWRIVINIWTMRAGWCPLPWMSRPLPGGEGQQESDLITRHIRSLGTHLWGRGLCGFAGRARLDHSRVQEGSPYPLGPAWWPSLPPPTSCPSASEHKCPPPSSSWVSSHPHSLTPSLPHLCWSHVTSPVMSYLYTSVMCWSLAYPKIQIIERWLPWWLTQLGKAGEVALPSLTLILAIKLTYL